MSHLCAESGKVAWDATGGVGLNYRPANSHRGQLPAVTTSPLSYQMPFIHAFIRRTLSRFWSAVGVTAGAVVFWMIPLPTAAAAVSKAGGLFYFVFVCFGLDDNQSARPPSV